MGTIKEAEVIGTFLTNTKTGKTVFIPNPKYMKKQTKSKPKVKISVDVSEFKNALGVKAKPLYELFKDKSGKWKWRKRFKNGKIPNHQYNSKAAAIKGIRADYKATNENEFRWKEVK